MTGNRQRRRQDLLPDVRSGVLLAAFCVLEGDCRMTKLNGASAFSRRSFLKRSAETMALLAAARAALPNGAFAESSGPEVTGAKLGFIALTDASALIVAKEKGFFVKHGVPDVEVLKQASWGATRDNLVLGSEGNGIDGAHILTPMPYLMTTGKITQNNVPLPMKILARLNLDAQAISIANAYADLKVGTDAGVLKKAFAEKKAAGAPAKVAMTFPGGTHDLWLRYWLAAGGINPDEDVETIVVPPPQMVANMKVGTMDCFCVGEPWNAQLVNQGIGFTAVNTAEIWAKHPEKSLALRADFVERNPKTVEAILMAVMEAQQWCDDFANKEEMAGIVAKRSWFNVPKTDIIGRLKGEYDYGGGKIVAESPHFMKFWRDAASFPFKSHDAWFLTENIRWGKLKPDTDIKSLVNTVNGADQWRAAAKTLGVADIPAGDSRGPETFFDGKIFDPENPATYLASLAIKHTA
jgi:nitrate/nitrite transport system substrate-binding protein